MHYNIICLKMQAAKYILMKKLGKLIRKNSEKRDGTMIETRTDLAMEAFENTGGAPLPGVSVKHWEENGVNLTEVLVTDNEAARQLGKPKGSYLTLESPLMKERDPDARLAMGALLGEEIDRMLPRGDDGASVLVVGLGNRSITPDSLGPSVVERTLVTRHMLSGPGGVRSNMKSVCAVSPGVLGVTGIESLELVRSLVEAIRPRAVLCVDSLSARDWRRIGATIQLTNTGIQPGAGVGNHRRALTQESLGAPVVSLGMPTVIYAATLAKDAFAWLNAASGDEDAHEEALEEMERTLLKGEIGEMIVTPREIDAIIQDAAGVIASGINRALQPELSEEEIASMTS